MLRRHVNHDLPQDEHAALTPRNLKRPELANQTHCCPSGLLRIPTAVPLVASWWLPPLALAGSDSLRKPAIRGSLEISRNSLAHSCGAPQRPTSCWKRHIAHATLGLLPNNHDGKGLRKTRSHLLGLCLLPGESLHAWVHPVSPPTAARLSCTRKMCMFRFALPPSTCTTWQAKSFGLLALPKTYKICHAVPMTPQHLQRPTHGCTFHRSVQSSTHFCSTPTQDLNNTYSIHPTSSLLLCFFQHIILEYPLKPASYHNIRIHRVNFPEILMMPTSCIISRVPSPDRFSKPLQCIMAASAGPYNARHQPSCLSFTTHHSSLQSRTFTQAVLNLQNVSQPTTCFCMHSVSVLPPQHASSTYSLSCGVMTIDLSTHLLGIFIPMFHDCPSTSLHADLVKTFYASDSLYLLATLHLPATLLTPFCPTSVLSSLPNMFNGLLPHQFPSHTAKKTCRLWLHQFTREDGLTPPILLSLMLGQPQLPSLHTLHRISKITSFTPLHLSSQSFLNETSGRKQKP